MRILFKAINWIVEKIKTYFSKEARAERRAKAKTKRAKEEEERARKAKAREALKQATIDYTKSVSTIANDNVSEFINAKDFTESIILEFIHTKQYSKIREMCNPVFGNVKYSVNPYKQTISYTSTIFEYYDNDDYKTSYNWFIAAIKGAVKAKYPKAYFSIDTPIMIGINMLKNDDDEPKPVKKVLKLHFNVYSDRIGTGYGSHEVTGTL